MFFEGNKEKKLIEKCKDFLKWFLILITSLPLHESVKNVFLELTMP